MTWRWAAPLALGVALVTALEHGSTAVAEGPAPQSGGVTNADTGTPPSAGEPDPPRRRPQRGQARHPEPPVDRVVQAALDAYRASFSELDGLAGRARLRGAVPTLELSARRGQTVDLSQNQNLTTDSVRLSTDDALTLQASLRFDLPRLVFAREEVTLSRERRRRREAQRAVVEEVTALYFERRRLLLRIAQHSEDEVMKLRIEEVEARLNSFTGGRFRQMIE